MQANDILRRWQAAVLLPRFHQVPALFEQVAAPICRFRLVGNHMRERRFANLVREGRTFCCPIPKGGTEAMYGGVLKLALSEENRLAADGEGG